MFVNQWFPRSWFEDHFFPKTGAPLAGHGQGQVGGHWSELMAAEAWAQAQSRWRDLEARRELELAVRLASAKRMFDLELKRQQALIRAAAFTIMLAEV